VALRRRQVVGHHRHRPPAGGTRHEVGPEQLDAAGVYGVESAAWFNHHAIHVCLVGNGDRAAPTDAQMQQLLKLVHAMQQRFDIPAERVLLAGNVAPTTSPGLLFPGSAFRAQLIQ